jgi:pyruvate/2-oxoglutarate dehydrogenase complex dihydrolipoamide dehydrogenase (E3) component
VDLVPLQARKREVRAALNNSFGFGGTNASLVVKNALFRLPEKVDHANIPWVTFTDPELAHVGLSEKDAAGQGIRFQILRWPYAENDRAQAERATDGFIKVIVSPRGKILGATIVGRSAGEIIQLWALAVSAGLDIKAMTGFVSPYPTLSEISKRAAIGFYSQSLTKPWLRRILSLLRSFG